MLNLFYLFVVSAFTTGCLEHYQKEQNFDQTLQSADSTSYPLPAVVPFENTIRMAVTIDDLPVVGARPESVTPTMIAGSVFQALSKHNLQGVMGFMNAITVDRNPNTKEILKQWLKEGHTLANHTYSHVSAQDVSAEEFIDDIKKDEPILQELVSA